jgi:hypothetical protein
MLGQHIIMHLPTHEDLGQDMTHLLPHPQNADRGTIRGFWFTHEQLLSNVMLNVFQHP